MRSCALPTYSTPSPPRQSRRRAFVTSSLRSPRTKRTIPPDSAASTSKAATKRRDIGAISADDGTGLPRTLRKNHDAPVPVCSNGT